MKATFKLLALSIATAAAMSSGCNSDSSILPQYVKTESIVESRSTLVLDSVSYYRNDSPTSGSIERFIYKWNADKTSLRVEQFNIPSSVEKPEIKIDVRSDTIYIYENTGESATYIGQELFYTISVLEYKPYIVQIVREGAETAYRPFEIKAIDYELSVSLRYVVDDYGIGTKVEHEVDSIIFRFALLNANLDPDSIFSAGETITFSFVATNMTDKEISYDYRDIGTIKEYGCIYDANTDEFVVRANVNFNTEEGRRTLLPWRSSLEKKTPFPMAMDDEEQPLAAGSYYTKFSGTMNNGITLPEFRIDFVVKEERRNHK